MQPSDRTDHLMRAYAAAVVQAAGGGMTLKDALSVIDKKKFEQLRRSYADQLKALKRDNDDDDQAVQRI